MLQFLTQRLPTSDVFFPCRRTPSQTRLDYMRVLIVSAFMAASVIGPLSASAQTYEEAAASGVSPATGGEMLDCAFYWSAWAQSLNPNHYGEGSGIWDPSWIETLNPAIRLPAAEETAQYWFLQAQADYEKYDDRAEYDQRMLDAPEFDVEALDERKFIRLLGECARPE